MCQMLGLSNIDVPLLVGDEEKSIGSVSAGSVVVTAAVLEEAEWVLDVEIDFKFVEGTGGVVEYAPKYLSSLEFLI